MHNIHTHTHTISEHDRFPPPTGKQTAPTHRHTLCRHIVFIILPSDEKVGSTFHLYFFRGRYAQTVLTRVRTGKPPATATCACVFTLAQSSQHTDFGRNAAQMRRNLRRGTDVTVGDGRQQPNGKYNNIYNRITMTMPPAAAAERTLPREWHANRTTFAGLLIIECSSAVLPLTPHGMDFEWQPTPTPISIIHLTAATARVM